MHMTDHEKVWGMSKSMEDVDSSKVIDMHQFAAERASMLSAAEEEMDETTAKEGMDSETDSTTSAETQPENHFTEQEVEDGRVEFEKILDMPFIDLYTTYTTAKQDLSDLESLATEINQLNSEMADTTLQNMIRSMNIMASSKLDLSVKDFREQYPSLKRKLALNTEILRRCINQFSSDQVMSSTFITQSMIASGKARLQEIMERDPHPINYTLIVKKIQETIQIYQNRPSFDMLLHKLKFQSNIMNCYKKFISIGPDKAMKYINRVLQPETNDPNLMRFRRDFIEHSVLPNVGKNVSADDSSVTVPVFFMTYWLATVFEKEFQSGKAVEVKLFILNYHDADKSSNIYDLPGGKAYLYAMGYLIFNLLSQGMQGRKQKNSITPAQIEQIIDMNHSTLAKMLEDAPESMYRGATSLRSIMPNLDYMEMMDDYFHPVSDVEERLETTFDEEENDMTNMQNQASDGEFNDLGAGSMDPTIEPEMPDNMDDEAIEEAEASDTSEVSDVEATESDATTSTSSVAN